MKNLVTETLLQYVNSMPPSRLKEAAIYAIKAGGKRFRPLVILSIIDSYGLDYQAYLKVASSIEMIHLYSLIHDDLPAMDNDSLRHGVPTIHKQFDEGTAILLGDGLLTNAFDMVITQPLLSADAKLRIIEILSQRAGLQGMVYGQHLDLEHEGKQADLETLNSISLNKTGKLLEAAFRIGAVIASPHEEALWGEIGLKLGLMFQIQDDVLEVTTNEATLQKSKSDVALNKATFVSQLGLEKSRLMVNALYDEISAKISTLAMKHQTIVTLINTIYLRQY